jgi:hypothetical protein
LTGESNESNPSPDTTEINRTSRVSHSDATQKIDAIFLLFTVEDLKVKVLAYNNLVVLLFLLLRHCFWWSNNDVDLDPNASLLKLSRGGNFTGELIDVACSL